MLVVLILAVGYVFPAIHVLLTGAVASIFGVEVQKIAIGIGPSLFTYKAFHLKLIPLGGYLKLKDLPDENSELGDPDRNIVTNVPMQSSQSDFSSKPVLVRLFVTLSGYIGILLISLAVLQNEFLQIFINGFYQVVSGALHPLTDGQSYLQETKKYWLDNSLTVFIAAVGVKLSVLNLLPLGLLAGGQVLELLLNPKRKANRALGVYILLSSFVALTIIFGWIIAYVTFTWHMLKV